MLDSEDRSEQSQRDYQFATNKTVKNATMHPDPILVWAQSGKLNPVLETSALMIRKAIKYLSRDTGVQSLNYLTLDCPGGRSLTRTTDESYEPREVRRYLTWSPKVISKFGQEKFHLIIDCIVDGEECDWGLFQSAVKLY